MLGRRDQSRKGTRSSWARAATAALFFAASHRADLPLLRAGTVLALLGEDLRAVLVTRRSHAEPLAVLDRDLLPSELARTITVTEFSRRAASALTGAPASTVRWSPAWSSL